MHSSLKPTKRGPFLLALGLALAACNVFNPSGEGDGGESADALMAEAENAFRNQDYPGAIAGFEKAIAQDSNNSLAYYGFAKATMRYWQVNASALLTEVDKIKHKTGLPFIGSDDWTVTRYLQATSKTRRALSLLTERDTLTRWYNYTVDPNSAAARKDPKRQQRIDFMTEYWKQADLGARGYRPKSRFPLSDLRLGYDKIIGDYGFVELIYAVTHLKDFDANDTIDSRDNILNLLTFNIGDGGLKIDNLEDIGAVLNTPENQANMNRLIQNVSDGLNSAGTVIDLLAPLLGQTGDTAGLPDSLKGANLQGAVTENMQTVIDSIGDAITFYQFGDGKDNDGDGCRDEEILDGKDNDGDGVVDEDSRLKPILLGDQVDNDGDKTTDESDENPGSGDVLGFVSASAYVKGPKYQDKAAKVAVQKDSLSVRTTLTAAEQIKLTAAKQDIGGCWNNY